MNEMSYLVSLPFNFDYHWYLSNLEEIKVMRRAVSCKHRQAVKTMQVEKKFFKYHLHSS